MTDFDLAPGDTILRKSLNQRFGGGPQGGIITPARQNFLFVFSDDASKKLMVMTSTDGKMTPISDTATWAKEH